MKTVPLPRYLPALLLLLLAIALPQRTRAQYLYLDLNGDGLNTSADVLKGLLPVNVDIYLRTDRNRDGSPATCVSGSQPLSVGSFEFVLRSTGGSVLWGAFSGGLFGGATRTAHNATDFYAGYFDASPEFLPPGPIRLGRLSVTPLTGTPLLSFVSTTPLSPVYLTSFGSQCGGVEGDNTMKLGREWNDADGTFGTLLSNVSGTVYLDSNGSGCGLESGETGMGGWIVTLSPGGQSVLTSDDGRYRFANVLPGLYSVRVSRPSSWSQTCPSGGGAQAVTVLVGQTYSNLNFGLRPTNPPAPLRSEKIVSANAQSTSAAAAVPEGRLEVSVSPNPLNPIGKITFRTHRPGFIRARLFDLSGRLVRTLQDSPVAPAGDHQLVLNGRDDAGRPLASGVYFFKIDTSEGSQMGRAILMK